MLKTPHLISVVAVNTTLEYAAGALKLLLLLLPEGVPVSPNAQR